MKIHIIEDDQNLQEIYKQLFTAAGHEASASENGLYGITDIVDIQPDVILLDLMMREMNGLEFLQTLKNNTSMRPIIIACSNLSQYSMVQRAIELGAVAYLKKSDYIGSDLVDAVTDIYQKQQAKAARKAAEMADTPTPPAAAQ